MNLYTEDRYPISRLLYVGIHIVPTWKSNMNPKALQDLMGYSGISVTLNTYTHVKLENARDEIVLLKIV